MIRKMAGVIGLTMLLIGCATHSRHIQPKPIASAAYEGLSCSQLGLHRLSVQQDLFWATEKQNKAAIDDAMNAAVGFITIGISLLNLEGDEGAERVALLKGHLKTIKEVQSSKCDPLDLVLSPPSKLYDN